MPNFAYQANHSGAQEAAGRTTQARVSSDGEKLCEQVWAEPGQQVAKTYRILDVCLALVRLLDIAITGRLLGTSFEAATKFVDRGYRLLSQLDAPF